MEINEEVWMIARNAAFRVDFVKTGRELHLYTSAIYSAIMWGWEERIEEKEKEARQRVYEVITLKHENND